VRTVQRVNQIRPGFTADGVLSFRLALPRSRYPDQAAFNAFSRHLQDTLGGVPGVRGAAAISHAPYDHVPNWGGPYLTERGAAPSTAPQADYRAVSPGAMELLGVSLVGGRFFAEEDDVRHAPVVIIDESLAQRGWPREDAVGKALGVDPDVRGTPSTWATVVGVVRHVRHRSPVEEVRPQVYFPLRQVVRNPSVYLVKTDGDPATLAPSVRRRLGALDAALPIYDVRPLSAYLDDARALRRFTTLLAVLFAVVAILLAAVGVYGLIAYLVEGRTREFAVRIALGARGFDVMRLVCRNGAVLVMTGTGLGLLLAAGAARWLRQELYGVTPWDPVAIGVTVGIFVVVAVVASVWPARRAIRSNPVIALRAD
jgi:predicted permease